MDLKTTLQQNVWWNNFINKFFGRRALFCYPVHSEVAICFNLAIFLIKNEIFKAVYIILCQVISLKITFCTEKFATRFQFFSTIMVLAADKFWKSLFLESVSNVLDKNLFFKKLALTVVRDLNLSVFWSVSCLLQKVSLNKYWSESPSYDSFAENYTTREKEYVRT